MERAPDAVEPASVDPASAEVADYAAVPAAGPDAELDPNWASLRGPSALPEIYMPPAMPGAHRSWQRSVAWLLIGVFVAATAVGACLVYGPSHPFW